MLSIRKPTESSILDALFLVDDADDLRGVLRRENRHFRVEIHGFRNAAQRIFREI